MDDRSKTIGVCLRERAEHTPNRIGLSCREARYTWGEMDRISDYLAARCLRQGMRRGEHAAIWGVNSPEWVLNYYALVKIGVIPVLINTCFKAEELEGVLLDQDVSFLLYGSGCKGVSYGTILETIDWEFLPRVRTLLSMETVEEEDWYHAEDWTARLVQAGSLVRPEDTASILFTSGTTTRPKGVMLSHHNLVTNSGELAKQMRWDETDIFCLSVPLFHCFGITGGILAGLHAGAQIHLLKYYKTIEVLEQIDQFRCTVLNGVPTMFLAIMRNERRGCYDLTSLKSGIIAGSPVLASEYLDICRNLEIDHLQISYGQTESSPCITISPYEETVLEKAGSAGKRIPGIELGIRNRKDQMASFGEEGEIITRGYHVMQGYYKRPEETAKTIDSDGWLHTGDQGFLDEEGNLHITGRIRDMIIRGGENISPVEIESCILKMEQVEAVKVVGIPAAVLQEEIAACIIPVKGARIEEEAVRDFVKARLSDYKVPRYVITCGEFPLNESGKIKTNELRCLAQNRINETIRGGR